MNKELPVPVMEVTHDRGKMKLLAPETFEEWAEFHKRWWDRRFTRINGEPGSQGYEKEQHRLYSIYLQKRYLHMGMCVRLFVRGFRERRKRANKD